MDLEASRRLLAIVLSLSMFLLVGCLEDPSRAGAECPAEPTADAGPQGEVNLSWEPVEDAESYPILRSAPDAEPTLVANVSASSTSYTDPTAQPGTTYSYTVHSWNGTARSTDCPASEVSAVPFFPGLAATLAVGGLAALGFLGLQRRA